MRIFTSQESTEVKSLTVTVSKSGALKPVVNIEAVELEGATVKNPTGYNAKFCYSNLIAPGAIVEVIRSGAVIPKIISVLKPAKIEDVKKAFEFCPACGWETKWNETKTDKVCTYHKCPGVKFAKLKYFCEQMEYEDIGEETIKSVFDAGVQTVKQLLEIDIDDLLKINGVGVDTANKIIDKNRSLYDNENSLAKLLSASDLFVGIGEKKSELLLSVLADCVIEAWLNGTDEWLKGGCPVKWDDVDNGLLNKKGDRSFNNKQFHVKKVYICNMAKGNWPSVLFRRYKTNRYTVFCIKHLFFWN